MLAHEEGVFVGRGYDKGQTQRQKHEDEDGHKDGGIRHNIVHETGCDEA